MVHEKVNSGFICALRAAYPSEKIRLYADKTHIEALVRTFARDGISIQGLEFKPIRLPGLSGFAGALLYYLLFGKMLSDAQALRVDKIFFLSFDPKELFAIKKLKQRSQHAHFKFSFVLHGIFEAIANDSSSASAIVLPRKSLPRRGLLQKLQLTRLAGLPGDILRRMAAAMLKPSPVRKVLGFEFFDIKKIMEFRHSSDYRYVSLSFHATKNAARYLDTSRFELCTVSMPVNFLEPKPNPKNEFAKFAAFGNVDSLVLHNIAHAVSERKPRAHYEIRVIGKNHFGVVGIPNVTCVGEWGKRLERVEMEMRAWDIDFFLILCDENQYRLTCGGVIFEALSLVKPIVHFDNECINQFNTEDTPIGFRCHSFDEYIGKLVDIIENYESYKSSLSSFREGILRQRDVFAIENSVPAVRQSFEW